MKMKTAILAIGILFIAAFSNGACRNKISKANQAEIISMNSNGKGQLIEIEYRKGIKHSHPLFAIWLETQEGKYIQTLYVSESIGKGIFKYGNSKSGKWMPGPLRRPAALPYWSHKRNVIESDGLLIPTENTAIPDAYTAATPSADFNMFARIDSPISTPFKILLEINQSFDWNNYWHNERFGNDTAYKSSAQPALVYSTEIIDPQNLKELYPMTILGHSHYNGSNGEINSDLSTISTALEITSSITIRIR